MVALREVPGCQNGAVTTWKPHALARPAKNQLEIPLKRSLAGGAVKLPQYVEAVRDLPGVPTGTKGRVLLANGFNWMRYRVQFANGVELNDLTGDDIKASTKK